MESGGGSDGWQEKTGRGAKLKRHYANKGIMTQLGRVSLSSLDVGVRERLF